MTKTPSKSANEIPSVRSQLVQSAREEAANRLVKRRSSIASLPEVTLPPSLPASICTSPLARDREENKRISSISILPPDPRKWTPRHLSHYLSHHLFRNVPGPIRDTLSEFVINTSLSGKGFLRLREAELESRGINPKWRRLMIEGSRRLRREGLKRRLWATHEVSTEEEEDGQQAVGLGLPASLGRLTPGQERVMTTTLRRIRERKHIRTLIRGFESPPVAVDVSLPGASPPSPTPRRRLRQDSSASLLSLASSQSDVSFAAPETGISVRQRARSFTELSDALTKPTQPRSARPVKQQTLPSGLQAEEAHLDSQEQDEDDNIFPSEVSWTAMAQEEVSALLRSTDDPPQLHKHQPVDQASPAVDQVQSPKTSPQPRPDASDYDMATVRPRTRAHTPPGGILDSTLYLPVSMAQDLEVDEQAIMSDTCSEREEDTNAQHGLTASAGPNVPSMAANDYQATSAEPTETLSWPADVLELPSTPPLPDTSPAVDRLEELSNLWADATVEQRDDFTHGFRDDTVDSKQVEPSLTFEENDLPSQPSRVLTSLPLDSCDFSGGGTMDTASMDPRDKSMLPDRSTPVEADEEIDTCEALVDFYESIESEEAKPLIASSANSNDSGSPLPSPVGEAGPVQYVDAEEDEKTPQVQTFPPLAALLHLFRGPQEAKASLPQGRSPSGSWRGSFEKWTGASMYLVGIGVGVGVVVGREVWVKSASR